MEKTKIYLYTSLIQQLLYNSKFEPKNQLKQIQGYNQDVKRSNSFCQIYVNKQERNVIVVHRGTDFSSLFDILTSLIYILGTKTVYKNTKRFSIAKKIQKRVI